MAFGDPRNQSYDALKDMVDYADRLKYETHIKELEIRRAQLEAEARIQRHPAPQPQYIPAFRSPIPENAAKFDPEWFARYERARDKLIAEEHGGGD